MGPTREALIIDPGLGVLPGPNFQFLLNFWRDLRGDQLIPSAGAIRADSFPPDILPNLCVIEIEPISKQLRFRLVGTGFARAVGFDPTSRIADEIPGAAATNARFIQCTITKRPYYYEGPLIWSSKDFKSYRALVMPFGDESNIVTRFVSYTEFD